MINFLKARKLLVAGGIVAVGVLIIVLPYGLAQFNKWNGERGVENLKKSLEKAAKDDYDLAMSDTYGGKTPKETLGMFITAIEKDDFELASKYFILSKQVEWGDALVKGAKGNKLNVLIDEVKKAIEEIGKDKQEWEIKKDYIAHTSVLFDFVKYPNGIWKIREI